MPSRELAAKHYAEHDGKPFFPKLVDFLSSGAVVVGCRNHHVLFFHWPTSLVCDSYCAAYLLARPSHTPPSAPPGPASPLTQAMVFEGKDIVRTGRTMVGATNPLASSPGTLR